MPESTAGDANLPEGAAARDLLEASTPTTAWACTPGPHDEPRQAVVLIHGLGDQPPMRSLRSFTWGIGLRRLFSSPDRITDSTELRRLSEPPTAHRRAHTDYFELYWANLAPDSDWRTSALWMLRLLLRPRWWRRRGAAARLVVTLQVVMLAAVLHLAWGVVAAVRDAGAAGLLEAFARWQVWAGLALTAGGLLLGRFLRAYLSDAVRYLAPRPANIAARKAIRDEGLTLLRRLHAGRYRRIIVVGHSLGSVIGMDLLRCLWDEMRHPDPRIAGDQQALDAFDVAADRIDPGRPATAVLRHAPNDLAIGVHPAREVEACEMDAFQAAQFELWRSQRVDGVPWLVTDLVTAGSPLTYAPLLLDEPPGAFGGRPGLTLAQLQGLKEVPRCPPIHDELTDSRFYPRGYDLPPDGCRRLRVGHTAAAFGPTRWTNLYLPTAGLLHGDLFGGPLAAHFGPGVRDVPVRVEGTGVWASLRRCFPLAHLSYWWRPGGGPQRMPEPVPLPSGGSAAHPGSPPLETVTALVSAMRLDDIRRAP